MRIKFFLSLFLFTTIVANAQKQYHLEGNEIKLDKTISFQPGTAVFKPESDEALSIIKGYLDEKTYISLLRVEGHTSGTGNATKDQQLSEDRAFAICKKLVESGVDCKRLIAVGFGNNKPIVATGTPEANAQNERIGFVNAALRGHNIGGQEPDGGGRVAGTALCKE